MYDFAPCISRAVFITFASWFLRFRLGGKALTDPVHLHHLAKTREKERERSVAPNLVLEVGTADRK
jgi:hypothetical protein